MGSMLVQGLAKKSITAVELKERVEQDPALLPEVLAGVHASTPAIRYGCSKALLLLSQDHPEQVYPHMDFFIRLLDSKYRILVWNALTIIAQLTRVDTKKNFDPIFEKYYGFLQNEYLVTVATVVGNSGVIAQAKPYLVSRITRELLTVERLKTGPHLTAECKRVIAEKTIDAFTLFFETVENQHDVVRFVERYRTSTRKTLREKAERFIQDWGTHGRH